MITAKNDGMRFKNERFYEMRRNQQKHKIVWTMRNEYVDMSKICTC